MGPDLDRSNGGASPTRALALKVALFELDRGVRALSSLRSVSEMPERAARLVFPPGGR